MILTFKNSEKEIKDKQKMEDLFYKKIIEYKGLISDRFLWETDIKGNYLKDYKEIEEHNNKEVGCLSYIIAYELKSNKINFIGDEAHVYKKNITIEKISNILQKNNIDFISYLNFIELEKIHSIEIIDNKYVKII